MPRQESRAKSSDKAIAASGRMVGRTDYRLASGGREPGTRLEAWQIDAWRFFDIVGEFEFAANWVGNLLSRATLHIEKNGERVEDSDPAAQYLEMYFGGELGRAQMLRATGIHHTVAGECLHVGFTDSNGNDVWQVAAPSQVKKVGKGWQINGVIHELSEPPAQVRIWDPHPFKPEFANSPARAALPILAEIEGLTMHVAAQIDSRLTSAGILLVPNEMAFAAASQNTEGEVNPTSGTTDFVNTLQKVMGAAIQDRSSSEANVPIVVNADGENLQYVKHIKFWSGLDEHSIALRSEAIRRLALSMDMPPEVLLGTGDSNHWASWSVDESAIKSHTEPLLFRICSDITEGYIRNLLVDDGMSEEEAAEYKVVADTSELRLRPNRSKEAFELYDRGALNDAALLRETGFDAGEDIPDEEERKVHLMRKIASGSATPHMIAQVATMMGLPLEAAPADTDVPNEARPDPSLIEHPTQGPPDEVKSEQRVRREENKAALIAASEQIVFRALERAGNKTVNQLKLSPPKGIDSPEAYLFVDIPEGKIDFVLEGAVVHLERFADEHGVDADKWSSALDAYCRTLLSKKKRYTRASLTVALRNLEPAHD